MKKLSKRITAILGTATLAVGLMAVPVLAGTNQRQESGGLAEMQNAMQTGSIQTMQEFMNSDSVVKAQNGQDNLARMNQFMNQNGTMMKVKRTGTLDNNTMMGWSR
ncbi:hypothetical protein [Desulfosporosinus sp. SB140]|uniref:hypothetical protein n=1 Tax=Desulfosporosinus paludis TaxID=3115649 RepID=UPI003890A09D